MRATQSSMKSSDLKDALYDGFSYPVDDISGMAAGGTFNANPDQLVDNNVATDAAPNAVNQYVEIDLGVPAYIKRYRIYFDAVSPAGNRYRIQAYVDGAWVDAIVGIIDESADAWGAWTDFTTPRTAILWRLEVTTYVAGARLNELELMGVTIGD